MADDTEEKEEKFDGDSQGVQKIESANDAEADSTVDMSLIEEFEFIVANGEESLNANNRFVNSME